MRGALALSTALANPDSIGQPGNEVNQANAQML
jgi:hypothetical protein